MVQEETLAALVNFVTLTVPASFVEGDEDALASLFFAVIRDVILCMFELISYVIFSVLELISSVNPCKGIPCSKSFLYSFFRVFKMGFTLL